MNKQWLGLCLLIALLLCGAAAANAEIVNSGTILFTDGTENGVWSLDDQGVLYIDCVDFCYRCQVPAEINELIDNVNTIRFSEKVEAIDYTRFYYKRNILSYEVDEGNPSFSSAGGFLCSKDGTVLLRCPPGKQGTVTVPDGVQVIGFNAFYECRLLTEIILPDSVEELEQQAMANCDELLSLHIPRSTSTIHYLALQGCRKLSAFSADPQNDTFCAEDGVLLTKDPRAVYLFPYAQNETYTAPVVEEIASRAFMWRSNIFNVTIPEGLTALRSAAFEGSSIQEIHLPSSLALIEEDAFAECEQLKAVYFSGTQSQWAQIETQNGNGPLLLNTVHCADGDYPPQPISGEMGYGVTYTLTPEGLLTVSGAGNWQSSIFHDNQIIRQVVLEPGVTEVGWNAFMYCNNLESITIPDSVTEIKYRAFYGCTALRSITIPSSVTMIGSMDVLGGSDGETFDGCSRLRNVYYGRTMAEWSSMVHPEYNSGMLLCTVHCSDGDIAPAYDQVQNYSCQALTDTVYRVSISGGYAFAGTGAIPNGTISYYGGIQEIEVMEGITAIGADCFVRVFDLNTVYLPVSLQSIGDNVFTECDQLAHVYYAGTRAQWGSVVIGEGVNPLLRMVLRCADDGEGYEPEKLVLPPDTESIGDYAFQGIAAEIVEIPVTCHSIGDGAFRDCPNLQIVYLPQNAILGEDVFAGCPEGILFIYR